LLIQKKAGRLKTSCLLTTDKIRGIKKQGVE
jgi:hypothetical protein